MTDWLAAAERARTKEDRAKFLRRHREEELRRTIRQCRDCPLNRSRKNAVPWDGKPVKPIAIVGEAPGAAEDKQGVPFVGQAGKLLDRLISQANYERGDSIIMNVICCRPPKNRKPTTEEVEACRPNFTAQLAASGAWTVLLMGATALSRLHPERKGKISDVRGHPFWKDGRIWMPTYHPAYVLRNRDVSGLVLIDVKRAFDIAYGRAWEPPDLVTPSITHDRTISSELEDQGWARIWSKRLRTELIVVKDQTITVPLEHHELIRYTVEEMVRIGEFARGEKLPKRQLRGIHYVKEIGGTIVT